MRPNYHLAIAILVLMAAKAQADTVIAQRQPTVVYEGGSTVSVLPYYRRLKRKDVVVSTSASAPQGAGALAMEDRLPLVPTFMNVGHPAMVTVPGLVIPIFVMGMDPISLAWFRDAVAGLVDIGARGIVVQASSKSEWLDLQTTAQAVGIDLMLLDGDSLARGYGITTYPVVLVDPTLAGEGQDE